MEKVKLDIATAIGEKKIARISFNSPRNLNAIDWILYEELNRKLDIVASGDDVGVLVLCSEVQNAFSAGVDVNFVRSLKNEEAGHFFDGLSRLLDRLAHFPLPTIACVNGYVFGAGADLALACDLRLASPSTVFRFPGPQFGLILGTQRLVNEIGASRARFLTLTNKKIAVQTALEYGLVHEIYENEKVVADIITNRILSLQRVPESTVETIKQLCFPKQHFSPNLTKRSVLHGDFGQRFYEYSKK